jgi:AraC-like DNA-binding protein
MLTNYSEVARFVGLDPEAMLNRAGIPQTVLNDPENWLSAASVLELLDASAAESGRDDFGVLLGAYRSFASLGPVSLLMRHQATLGRIVEVGAEYKHLLNDLLQIRVNDDGLNAVVAWNLIPGIHSSQAANLLATIAYRCICQGLETSWQPDCIHFRHAAPRWIDSFKRHFPCSLQFDSDFDGFSCPSNDLQLPNLFANASLAQQARRLLDKLPRVRRESASDKVRSMISFLIEDGGATIEHVAHCLGVDVRTLQRRLNKERTSFASLRNEVRRELVTRYLAGPTPPLVQVAQLAGYSSTSGLSRWFKEEFGVAPLTWRQRALENVR